MKTFIKWIFYIFVVLPFFISIAAFTFFHVTMTPEEKAAMEDAREQREAEEKAAREKREAEEREKGFHCLDDFVGSHRGVIRYLKRNLRDPSSFEHIKTSITPVNSEGNHALFMSYRARNGFGGMNIETLSAVVDNESCNATIISIE